MSDSTRKPRSRKASAVGPKKPNPDFPLYALPLGCWSKKLLGKIINFGRRVKVVDGKLTVLECRAGSGACNCCAFQGNLLRCFGPTRQRNRSTEIEIGPSTSCRFQEEAIVFQ